ncbi:hypothetical protein QZH41_002370 [Actinostola sp. cb2023]|nr:hypothetical protein QZH41_002370 [Actinostola sp. cb2023]
MAAVSAFGSVILTLYDDGSTGFYVGKIIMSMVLAKFFITISYNGIFLMAVELYPTIIRNVAQGTVGACAGIGTLVAAYVTYLIRVHPLLPYGIMGANALISGLLCLTLKETRDQPILEVLPEAQHEKQAIMFDTELLSRDA